MLLFILVDNNDELTRRVIGGVFGAVAGVLFLMSTIVLIICCIRVLMFKVCFAHSLSLALNTNIPALIPNYQL